MAKKLSDTSDTITHYQLDQDGFVVGVKGSCKAGDMQKAKIDSYYDSDVFLELGIRRID